MKLQTKNISHFVFAASTFYTVSIAPFLRLSSPIKLVSSERCTTLPLALVVGTTSLATERPFVESVTNLEGVCDLEGAFDEQRDDGLEFRFSRGISSDIGRETRGLESLDFGVPEWERSLCFVPVGVLIGALDGLAEELLCRCSLI